MADARTLTLTRGGRWHGYYGTTPCPVCQPEGRRDQNALTLKDGALGLLAHCKKAGCGFRDVIAALGIGRSAVSPVHAGATTRRDAIGRFEAEKRARAAQAVWTEAVPIRGTIAEAYLREARGITCALPDTLRFHPVCWHGPAARRGPALIARVDGAADFAAHRTWLRPDGSGKAPVDPARAMLGTTAGGAVQLAAGTEALAVAEGIETALSLLCGPLRGSVALWAALSATGMAALRLPDRPGHLIVATDGDAAGRLAGASLAERADALGWRVDMLAAPEGRDWNDVIRDRKGEAA
jgi:hypothetical protein